LAEFKMKLEAFKKKAEQLYADEENAPLSTGGPSTLSAVSAGHTIATQISPHSQSSDDDKETP
jgi:hypothetical protein